LLRLIVKLYPPVRWLAPSFNNRQQAIYPEPDLELRLARFLIMEAVIREKSGISELQNRNGLLLHICCASGLKAKLDVDRMENP
jgi:hypothetical protein